MTQTNLVKHLESIVGHDHLMTDPATTHDYRSGYRSGFGDVVAVVTPGCLTELWHCTKVAIDAGAVIIPQAANTGLTEGSTPKGVYDRPAIVVNVMRIKGLHLLGDADQVVALPGATLFELTERLSPYGREPHSVIGSTSIGATVVGGVCNNSGGALCRRGPAFTELALYARVNEAGELELINELGIDLGDSVETVLRRLEEGDFQPSDVDWNAGKASDDGYTTIIREVDEPVAARYNNDPRLLYGASGSAGKVMVFAVRLDTFAQESNVRTYYIGSNDPAQMAEFRARFLREASRLPINAEYLHRDLFDVARRYGKDSFLIIKWLGTARLPRALALKNAVDAVFRRLPLLPDPITDHILQLLSHLAPNPLPKRVMEWRERFEHHLILRVNGDMADETEGFLDACFPGAWFSCSADEGERAMLHRFAAAGAAVRYQIIHSREVEDLLALDIALARNDRDWFGDLPESITQDLIHGLYYGHFFCNVFHHDYVFRKGADVAGHKARLLELLDQRGAEYPAEHNVGHLYPAKPPLADFYRRLDPTNSFNPGVGKLSRAMGYKEETAQGSAD